MAYALFDQTKPDPATQAGTAFGTSTRENLLAIRDAVCLGVMPGFNFSTSGGTASQPGTIYFKKSTEWLKIVLTWGTVGGENGNVTVAVYSYSSNSGGAYDTIGTETNTYDTDGNCTATTWS
jgi:hypothetical protein